MYFVSAMYWIHSFKSVPPKLHVHGHLGTIGLTVGPPDYSGLPPKQFFSLDDRMDWTNKSYIVGVGNNT